MNLLAGAVKRIQPSLGRTRQWLTLGFILALTVASLSGCGGSSSSGTAAGTTGASTATASGTATTVPTDSVSPAYSHPAQLAEVRAAIESQGAQWTADDTVVSERVSNLQQTADINGDDGKEFDALAAQASRTAPPSAPPTVRDAASSSFSLQNNNGDWTTTPKDQGQYGTCVAFTSIGALECQIKIATSNPALPINLSEWCLWCEGTHSQNPVNGWDENLAATQLKNAGTVAQSDCPYTPAQWSSSFVFVPPATTAARYQVQSYAWVSGAAAMKTALRNGPLVTSMVVYPDFDNFYKGGVYKHVTTGDPSVDKYNSAGVCHAILLIGYDDTQGCWICKNSSGPYWGENTVDPTANAPGGYCRLAYGGLYKEEGYQYTVASSITFPASR